MQEDTHTPIVHAKTYTCTIQHVQHAYTYAHKTAS